jgi:hypothetical protein
VRGNTTLAGSSVITTGTMTSSKKINNNILMLHDLVFLEKFQTSTQNTFYANIWPGMIL